MELCFTDPIKRCESWDTIGVVHSDIGGCEAKWLLQVKERYEKD